MTSASPATTPPASDPPAAKDDPVARVVRHLEAVPLRRRLVAIVGTLVGAALILTSLATAYLMRSDLLDRVDSELRSVARPVANQVFDDLRSTGSAPWICASPWTRARPRSSCSAACAMP